MPEVPYRGCNCTGKKTRDKSLIATRQSVTQAQLSATVLLFSGCAKNVIPERGTYTVTGMVVIVMMT